MANTPDTTTALSYIGSVFSLKTMYNISDIIFNDIVTEFIDDLKQNEITRLSYKTISK